LAEAIEDVRDALDTEFKKRLREGLDAGISGSTAANVWSVLRTTFKESERARDRKLRMRTVDPSAGIKPPLTTPDRAKTFLYPVEATTLLACERVPREWRETYAVAIYLFVRPEELEALTWEDVDFTARTVGVSKAIDARTGKPKEMPKTENAVRDVPIEPTLLPLLRVMHTRRTSDEAPIVPALRTMNDKFRAKQLRDHLALAKLKRPRLTAERGREVRGGLGREDLGARESGIQNGRSFSSASCRMA
jgi:integrase